MEKARRLTVGEIAGLPLGAVVWCEDHMIVDCGEDGQVDGYMIFPMLVSVPGKNGLLVYADKDSATESKIDRIPKNRIMWSNQPGKEQIETGMPIDEALKIYNQYENRKYERE